MSEGRRGVAELSLSQLPQLLAWYELECAPSVAGLAKLDIEEARAKHALRLDIFNADLLELVEDLLDNVRVDENVFGNDVIDHGAPAFDDVLSWLLLKPYLVGDHDSCSEVHQDPACTGSRALPLAVFRQVSQPVSPPCSQEIE